MKISVELLSEFGFNLSSAMGTVQHARLESQLFAD